MPSPSTISQPNISSTLEQWLDYWQHIHHTSIDLGLERIRPVAQALGVLSTQLTPKPYIVMIAGTNGKGSTSKTIASIYHAAGLRVGLYQSPHIHVFNERIQISQQYATDRQLINAFVLVEQARLKCQLPLSFFEATTLAAFVAFTQSNCDVWVLEVGLGGRLDAVNLIDADVAVITNIGLDHVDWLGDNIEQIAFEKAGILRQGIPVIYGENHVPAAIINKAQALNCPLTVVGKDIFYRTVKHANKIQMLYATAGCTLSFDAIHLADRNIATAVTAVLKGAIPISYNALNQGIMQASMLGRFDVRKIAISTQETRTIILDVAHNVHGITFLLDLLAEFKQQYQLALSTSTQHCNVHFVWSMLADKDITGVIQTAKEQVKHWHIAPLNVERAAEITTLQHALHTQQITSYDTITAALNGAILASTTSDIIVVCGSFYTVQQALEALA